MSKLPLSEVTIEMLCNGVDNITSINEQVRDFA